MGKSQYSPTTVFLRVVILFITLFVFCSPLAVYAEEKPAPLPSVIFYEIMWAGSNADSGDEWLVLKNTTDDAIDLEGWYITRQNEDDKKFILSGAIASQGYYLISRKVKEESILAIDADAVFSGLILNNTNMILNLYNEEGGVIDSIKMAGIKPVPGSNSLPKASMIRAEPLSDGFWETNKRQENLDPLSEEYATPQNSGAPRLSVSDITQWLAVGISQNIDIRLEYGSDFSKLHLFIDGVKQESALKKENQSPFACRKQGENKIEVKVVDDNGLYAKETIVVTCYQFAEIIINEIMPMPNSDYNNDGKVDIYDEWIELYNPFKEKILLRGWQIYDSTSSYTFVEEEIGAGDFLVLFRRVSKISLNDDGESLTLFSPAGELVSEVEWSKAQRGFAYAHFDGEYLWTTTATPGKSNVFTAQPEEEKATKEKKEVIEEVDTSDVVKKAPVKKAVAYKNKTGNTGQKILSVALGGASLPKVNSDIGTGGVVHQQEEVIDKWGLGLVGVASLIALARLLVNVIFSLP